MDVRRAYAGSDTLTTLPKRDGPQVDGEGDRHRTGSWCTLQEDLERVGRHRDLRHEQRLRISPAGHARRWDRSPQLNVEPGGSFWSAPTRTATTCGVASTARRALTQPAAGNICQSSRTSSPRASQAGKTDGA